MSLSEDTGARAPIPELEHGHQHASPRAMLAIKAAWAAAALMPLMVALALWIRG
jgi:hypothetical protein